MNIEKIKKITENYFEKKGLNRYITDETAEQLLAIVTDNQEVDEKVDLLLKSLGQGLSENEKMKNKLVTCDANDALALLLKIDREV